MKRSNYKSPVYGTKMIPIDDIVSQKTNDNSHNVKSFQALTVSIFNSGYTYPVYLSNNSDYDPSTEGLPKPSLLTHSDGHKSSLIDGVSVGTQVSDDEIAKYFKYRLIDGSHRSQVIRLGKYFFENGYDQSKYWEQGNNIPEDPGKEMLAYIAWLNNFCIPATIVEASEEKQASATALMNRARGTHSLDSMKDIVYQLIMVSNMSIQWVSKNLFLDVSSIKRMIQLVGLRMVVMDDDNGNKSTDELDWSPEKSKRWKKMYNGYLTKEAIQFNERYAKEHNEPAPEGRGDAKAIARSHGWDFDKDIREQAIKNGSMRVEG